jgi:hypothetical protein
MVIGSEVDGEKGILRREGRGREVGDVEVVDAVEVETEARRRRSRRESQSG